MGLLLGLIPTGILIGCFGTLIGAGGGFILTPLLLLLYPQENPDTLTCISLSVTLINALSGSIAYAKMKRIHYHYGLIFSAASIPGAIVGASCTYYISRKIFDLLFAILLVGIALLLLRKGSDHPVSQEQSVIHLSKDQLFVGILISMVVGMVSSFMGIGGGIIHVPVLVNFLNFPVHIATATSHFILVMMTLIGTLVHIITGSFHHGIRRSIALSMGVLIGAQIGARFSLKVKGIMIIRVLSFALAAMGIRLLFLFFGE